MIPELTLKKVLGPRRWKKFALALENTRIIRPLDEHPLEPPTASEVLRATFPWHYSPQNRKYWLRVFNELRRKEL